MTTGIGKYWGTGSSCQCIREPARGLDTNSENESCVYAIIDAQGLFRFREIDFCIIWLVSARNLDLDFLRGGNLVTGKESTPAGTQLVQPGTRGAPCPASDWKHAGGG
jgi:hypothetical protein